MVRVALVEQCAPPPPDPLELAAREAGLEAAGRAGAQAARFTLTRRRASGVVRGEPVRHLFGWSAPRALRRALARSGPFDLIHALDAGAADVALLADTGLPVIMDCHDPALLAGIAPVEAALARAVLVPSTGVARAAQAAGARDALIIPPGCELPQRLRAPWPDPPLLVTAAPLAARRRHGDVLRSLAVLAESHPALRYEVIGDGPHRGELEGLADRLGVAERVDWAGVLDADEVRSRLAAATIVVMPSIDEPFGISYVEAMAAGVPAIGCRGEPGPEEIAAAGDGITLVPPGDIERLSQRIDELLSDAARLREASMRARTTVAEHFTLEQHAVLLLAAYEALAA